MDFSNVQARQAIKCEGIRELKGPISEDALKAIKKDGLKEVFFEADNKKYVAFGTDMDISKMKNSLHSTFKGVEITINFTDDEVNTAWGGAKAAVTSTAGAFVEGAATVFGVGAGALSTVKIWGGGASESAGLGALKGAVILAALSTAVVGTVGAVAGGLKSANYEALKSISTEIKN